MPTPGRSAPAPSRNDRGTAVAPKAVHSSHGNDGRAPMSVEAIDGLLTPVLETFARANRYQFACFMATSVHAKSESSTLTRGLTSLKMPTEIKMAFVSDAPPSRRNSLEMDLPDDPVDSEEDTEML